MVIGGGVAGLWSAAILARHGYSVLLIERTALGAGQTIASQGILHGGIKYTLGGAATAASKAVSEMPERWALAMANDPSADLDLRAVKTLSPFQHLWTTGSFFSRMTAKIAAKAIRTKVWTVPSERAFIALGAPDKHALGRHMEVMAVEEPIIEPRSLVTALRDEFIRLGGVIQIGTPRFEITPTSRLVHIDFATVRFSTAIIAAGAGAAALTDFMSAPPPMQRRPLHMVMARGDLPKVFGHCVAALSDKPRLTITSQRDSAGRNVWYIGGRIAEEGVSLEREAQIAAAKAEVSACLPWIRLDGVQWATLRIDRAEGTTADHSRPDLPVVVESTHLNAPIVTAWPTKLVFAPLVGDQVLQAVRRMLPTPSTPDGLAPLRTATSSAPVAPLPWQSQEVQWS